MIETITGLRRGIFMCLWSFLIIWLLVLGEGEGDRNVSEPEASQDIPKLISPSNDNKQASGGHTSLAQGERGESPHLCLPTHLWFWSAHYRDLGMRSEGRCLAASLKGKFFPWAVESEMKPSAARLDCKATAKTPAPKKKQKKKRVLRGSFVSRGEMREGLHDFSLSRWDISAKTRKPSSVWATLILPGEPQVQVRPWQ